MAVKSRGDRVTLGGIGRGKGVFHDAAPARPMLPAAAVPGRALAEDGFLTILRLSRIGP